MTVSNEHEIREQIQGKVVEDIIFLGFRTEIHFTDGTWLDVWVDGYRCEDLNQYVDLEIPE